MKMMELSSDEMPRTKVVSNSIESLSTKELIAVLLNSGNKDKSVLDLSQEVLKLIDSVYDLNELSIEELTRIKGIGIAKAVTILSAIELGKRLASKKIDTSKLTTPTELFDHFQPLFNNLKQEHLYAIYLNNRGQYIQKKLISIGSLNQTFVDDKSIFKWAYKFSATAIIIVHNHPSGDPTPSREDVRSTKLLYEKAQTLGFILLDHIIIGNDYFSFKAHFDFF